MVVCLSHFFLFVGLAHSKDKQSSQRDRVCVNKAYELSKVKGKENILYFGLSPVLSLRGGGFVRVGAAVMIGICWNAS